MESKQSRFRACFNWIVLGYNGQADLTTFFFFCLISNSVSCSLTFSINSTYRRMGSPSSSLSSRRKSCSALTAFPVPECSIISAEWNSLVTISTETVGKSLRSSRFVPVEKCNEPYRTWELMMTPVNQVRTAYGTIIFVLAIVITFLIAEVHWLQTCNYAKSQMIGNLIRQREGISSVVPVE